jgi:hypothetical protein
MTHRSTVCDGQLVDLSMSGARIETAHDVRLFSLLEVFLLPLGAKRHWAKVAGYVIRRKKSQIGVEWCELAPKPVCDLLKSYDPQSSDDYGEIDWHDRERIRSFKQQ